MSFSPRKSYFALKVSFMGTIAHIYKIQLYESQMKYFDATSTNLGVLFENLFCKERFSTAWQASHNQHHFAYLKIKTCLFITNVGDRNKERFID